MIATTISNIKENKREYGLDLFRILCCIFVINFHIWDLMILNSKSASVINFLLYQIGSFCVAGFFVMNGYFAGRKEDVCLKRIIKRIVRYFVLAFLITVIFCFLYIIFGLHAKTHFWNILKDLCKKELFLQYGILFHMRF